MTIRITVYDGEKHEWLYRNIYKGVNLAEAREGFYALRNIYRWGVMVQLKGKQRILMGDFGLVPEEEKP